MAATKSLPATRQRLWPCTPSPATTTRIVRTHSAELDTERQAPRPWSPIVPNGRAAGGLHCHRTNPDPSNKRYLALDGVNLAAQVVDRHRDIAVTLALDRRRHASQDGGRGGVTDREHGERSVSEQRVAGADRIHQPLHEAVDHEKAVMGFVVCAAAGEHAALGQLEDQKLAPCCVIDSRGQWPNA